LRDGERRPQDRTTSAAPSVSSAKGRVLVVDDEAEIRAAITHMLGRDNHEVLTAASGAEGRKLLEQDQGFDLVILDLMMPEVSGMELHRWLTETHPELADRVIFVTGGVFTPAAQSYLSEVDNMRLEKPLDTANFRKLVGNLVAGRVSGSQAE
jgi:CheY-like chemotaxis protein